MCLKQAFYGGHIMIGCVYVYQREFYSKLLADISTMPSAFGILAGDFNCVMCPELDHRSPSGTTPSKKTEATIELCSDLQLFDTWKVLHPGEKDYTFFLSPTSKLFPNRLFFCIKNGAR